MVIKKDSSDFDIFPTQPNEITALTEDELKYKNDYLNYNNHHPQYVIYNEALCRVRYIVQLSSEVDNNSTQGFGHNQYVKRSHGNKSINFKF